MAVDDAIALDDEVGLHPALAKLAARYDDGHVAIRWKGSSTPTPTSPLRVARVLVVGHAGGERRRRLARALSRRDRRSGRSSRRRLDWAGALALLGTQSFATSIADVSGLQLDRARVGRRDPWWWRRRTRRGVGRVRPGLARPPHADGRGAAGDRATPSRPAGGSTGTSPAFDRPPRPARRYRGERGERGATSATGSLALAAQLVASDRRAVGHLSGLGDFDTHQGQAQRQPALLRDLDAGLDSFFTTVEAAGRADRALVMTVSEFGRRPGENGSGTDHGTAAPHFLIGPAVKGGRYGAPPSLTALDRTGTPSRPPISARSTRPARELARRGPVRRARPGRRLRPPARPRLTPSLTGVFERLAELEIELEKLESRLPEIYASGDQAAALPPPAVATPS